MARDAMTSSWRRMAGRGRHPGGRTGARVAVVAVLGLVSAGMPDLEEIVCADPMEVAGGRFALDRAMDGTLGDGLITWDNDENLVGMTLPDMTVAWEFAAPDIRGIWQTGGIATPGGGTLLLSTWGGWLVGMSLPDGSELFRREIGVAPGPMLVHSGGSAGVLARGLGRRVGGSGQRLRGRVDSPLGALCGGPSLHCPGGFGTWTGAGS